MHEIAAIRERALDAIEARVFPGCVIGISEGGRSEIAAFGRHTYDAGSPAVTSESVYDLASLTKAVPTAILALQLIGEGAMALEGKLADYLPAFNGAYREQITIKHLLTYTVGGLRLSEFKDDAASAIEAAALSFEPDSPPGTKFFYSNIPALLLGFAIEKALGPLDEAADARIFKKLGMHATFCPTDAVPTEIVQGETIRAIVHDESARVFAKVGRSVGHAGLFGTAPDLIRFCEALLKNDGSIITPALFDAMTSNQIEGIGETGLGWELNQEHFMGSFRSKRTFGKTGFTGTSIVCDKDQNIALVILSNRTYPSRPHDAQAINAFRREIADIVFSHRNEHGARMV